MSVVDLKDGPCVPMEAVALAMALEARGYQCLKHADGRLRVARKDEGKPDLTDEDRAAITKWKVHLLAIVDYCSTERAIP